MHTCAIAIGPLTLAISCADATLTTALHRRYAPFLSEAHPSIVIEAALGVPEHQPEQIQVAGARATMAGPGMEAQIDLAAGCAQLLATPSGAIEATEQLLRVVCALVACDSGGLLVHAAAIASGPRAFLFLGPSGAGKTTVARNAAGRRVLNDDLALLWPTDNAWDVCATPFSNPTQVPPDGPARARLTALLHLVQAPIVARSPIAPAVAIATLAARAPIVGGDPHRGTLLLQRCRTICAIVPSDRLRLRPDPGFWQILDPQP